MENRAMVSTNRAEEPRVFPPMGRHRNSLYNLTLDEVQTQLGDMGKPVYSMNLDELVKNVISAESGQWVHHNPSPSSSAASFFLGNMNLNGSLSKKTVDEVWKEIVHHHRLNTFQDNKLVQQQLNNLGETTLEEFLVRASVIDMGNDQDRVMEAHSMMSIDHPMVVVSGQQDWLPLQMASIQQQQEQQMAGMASDFSVSESIYENQVVDIGYAENHPVVISMPKMGAMTTAESSLDSQAAERKRRYSDEMEKTIERRQKRMIKNRESAARSRARKQAYTNQLEHEVFRLKKTNNWLKKQKEVEKLLSSATTPMPRYQLRRTSSSTF